MEEVRSIHVGLPSPADLFNLVWKLVPDFVKNEIRELAANSKDQQIARAITEYVKMALSALPIPVPAIFLNAAANLVIPPLVSYIMEHLADTNTRVGLPVSFLCAKDMCAQLHTCPQHPQGAQGPW